jgi:hypothetical protein
MNFMTTFRSVVDRVQSRVIPETAQALTLLCKPVGLFCTERRVVRVMDSVKQQRRTRRHLAQHDPQASGKFFHPGLQKTVAFQPGMFVTFNSRTI